MAAAGKTATDIQKDLTRQLYWDPKIENPQNIGITVSGSHVTLSGVVESIAALRSAELDARLVPGVVSVDNQLTVQAPPSMRSASDKDLEAALAERLQWHSSVAPRRISISVIDGKAILEGTVDSIEQKLRAGEMATDVPGIEDVDNRLAVTPPEAFSDEAIAADIGAAIRQNTLLAKSIIKVGVVNGEVVLSGTVTDRSALRAADDIALFARGVRKVNNKLVILSP